VKPIVPPGAGLNGAGKTTLSRTVIAEHAGVTNFVNADVIAAGLAGVDPAGGP